MICFDSFRHFFDMFWQVLTLFWHVLIHFWQFLTFFLTDSHTGGQIDRTTYLIWHVWHLFDMFWHFFESFWHFWKLFDWQTDRQNLDVKAPARSLKIKALGNFTWKRRRKVTELKLFIYISKSQKWFGCLSLKVLSRLVSLSVCRKNCSFYWLFVEHT